MFKGGIASEMSMSGDSGRLLSLDAFRGATIAAMILVNNANMARGTFVSLRHAKWNGWAFADLVFPFFLWIVGVSMTFSFTRRINEGAKKHQLMLHTLRRAALLIGLGLLLNGLPYYNLNLETIRIPGVLQRIGICYLVGATIFIYASWHAQVSWIIGLYTAYWATMTLIPVPGFGPGVLNPNGNFSQYIDNLLMSKHLNTSGMGVDPEGIISTLPAISNVLVGTLCGMLLQHGGLDAREKTIWMFVWGLALASLAEILDHFMPINKRIWTPSFALLTSGLALLAFACYYWFIDVLRHRDWCGPLVIYGANPILIYVMSVVCAKLLVLSGVRGLLSRGFFEVIAPPVLASSLYGMMHVLLMYAVAWVLYKYRLFLRF